MAMDDPLLGAEVPVGPVCPVGTVIFHFDCATAQNFWKCNGFSGMHGPIIPDPGVPQSG